MTRGMKQKEHLGIKSGRKRDEPVLLTTPFNTVKKEEEIWKCEFGSQCSKVNKIGMECCPCAYLTVTPKVASVLLYLETCLVDQYGRVEGRRMNNEELEMVEKLVKDEFIHFGRLSFKSIGKLRETSMGKIYTYYVRFTPQAWQLTHRLRCERSERMIGKQNASC
jgi:hypothetical protein